MTAFRPPVVLALVLLLLPLLLLWPLPVVGGEALLAAPGFEAASHAWGLWAAGHLGQPLVVQTDLLAWPDGVRLVLVDPVNLPAFHLGNALGGPALGFNLVAWWGLALAGLAGALLAREADASPLLGAVLGACTPALVAAPGDGLTEDLALPWVGLQLALLLRYRRTGRPGTGLAAALALGACAYAGPYAALLAAVVDLPVALAGARARQPLLRAVAVGAGGLVLALPAILAVASRPADLPGGTGRAGLPVVDEGPERWRGGLMHGVDLLDPWLPAPLTSGVPEVGHSGYLGVVLLAAAMVALWREPRRWPWLAGAVALLALALGPHLTSAGRALRVGGEPVLGPAGLLILALPAAGRITRWYRAAAVAGLLLVPLAARSVAGKPRRAALLAVGVLLDTLLLAPLPWPHPASAMPDATTWQAVAQAEPGAVLELPLTTSGTPPAGHWRDAGPLAQTLHGRPTSASMMGLPPSGVARRGQQAVQQLLRAGTLPPGAWEQLRAAGFTVVALHTTYLPLTEPGLAALDACLGPPLAVSPTLRLHALGAEARPCDQRSTMQEP